MQTISHQPHIYVRQDDPPDGGFVASIVGLTMGVVVLVLLTALDVNSATAIAGSPTEPAR